MKYIPKTAIDASQDFMPTRFYSSAREGMSELLRALGIDEASSVLLPAFIGYSVNEGSGVFDPVSQSGAKVSYYGLTDTLDPDLEGIEAALALGGVRVLVVIHYFGRTAQGLAKIRALSDKYNVVLVEDLAHAFFTANSGSEAGQFGDVLLYSLHKMFPLSDGGMLRFRRSELADICESTRPEKAQVVLDYDWLSIAAKRRQRFEEISSLLSESPGLGSVFELMWPDLGEFDVPQTLPVRILKGSRDQIYELMNKEGFGMVSLYHTLIPPVRGEFPNTLRLSREITNFPVHQDVDPTLVRPMISCFLTLANAESGTSSFGETLSAVAKKAN